MALRPSIGPALLAAAVFASAPLVSAGGPTVAPPAPRGLAEAFDVRAATVQRLELPERVDAVVSVPVTLGDSEHVLDLYPYSVRSPEHFEVLVQQADGALVPFDVGAPTTVRGLVRGVPGSFVAGDVTDGRLTATLGLHRDAPLWGIQPRSEVDAAAGADEHVVYVSSDTIDRGHTCGVDHEAQERAEVDTPAEGLGDGGGFVVCEIGIDADVEYFELNGSSVTQTENDIEQIINSTDAIYAIDSQIRYEITTIIVRTAEPDPYSSSNPSTLLNQFDSHWSFNQGGVQRDIAHLFTGRDINGGVIGIAKLGTICSQFNGYGLSQSRFTSNFTSRVALTAHELGHNWSAFHCDGASDCQIMCSGLGGCTGIITSFGSNSKASIANEKNSSGCLGPGSPPAPPSVSQVTPATKNLFGTSISDISIVGSNMAFVTSVTVDGVTFDEGDFSVVSDARIEVTPPAPTALGPVSVSVQSPFGASGSASFEWVSPPASLTTLGIAVSNFEQEWTYGGPAGDTAFLVISLSPAVTQFSGFDVLASPIILNVDTLDAFGLGEFSLLLPGSASGVTFYSQVVTFDSGVTDSSNVIETLVIF